MSTFFQTLENHKRWIVLNFPLFIMILLLFIDATYWKPLTAWSGYTAVFLFCGLLMLNPLRTLFATSSLLRKLNNYRRVIGVASFNYAFLHFMCFVIKRGGFIESFKWIFHPVLLPGFIALIVFIPLAITSNKFSLKQLKFPRWKKLHNTVYVAQWCIFIHMLLRGGETTLYGLLFFVPLMTLQLIRRYKRNQKKERQSTKTS